MGNCATNNGFNKPPLSYLDDLRRDADADLKNFLTDEKQRRDSNVISYAEPAISKSNTKVSNESVKKYIVSNPEFLDNFVRTYISQDRVRAWLQNPSESISSEDEAAGKPPEEEHRLPRARRLSAYEEDVIQKDARHQKLLLITRSRMTYPFKFDIEDLKSLIQRPHADESFKNIDNHLFPYTTIQPLDINRAVIHMAQKLLGKHAYPMSELCYFLSTLKANYNPIEYHNYHHALSHAQSMYFILKKNPCAFSELEKKALLIACISHDVGHPGVNERYIMDVHGGLEKLYDRPLLENHHVQTTFLILQDFKCNVFSRLDAGDYKTVLKCIRHAIISTDIDRYKMQTESVKQALGPAFDMNNKTDSMKVKSLLMMVCDLCAAWKNWNEHKHTVFSLYKEFFVQGDRSAEFGIGCPPQMLRSNTEEIPKYQQFFIENICLPIFQLLVKIFPNVSEVVKSTKENHKAWKDHKMF